MMKEAAFPKVGLTPTLNNNNAPKSISLTEDAFFITTYKNRDKEMKKDDIMSPPPPTKAKAINYKPPAPRRLHKIDSGMHTLFVNSVYQTCCCVVT